MTADTGEPGSRAAGNLDLLPVPRVQRTATAWEMAGLWLGLVIGVPSYYIAGSLVEEGMAWWQGISIVVAAKAILLVPLLLAAAPGTRYGIPFPVLVRAAFGVRGAHVPALLRALVACGWFGIESWIGGQAFFLLLPSSIRSSSLSRPLSWLATSPLELACFLLFWLVQLTVVWRGMRRIRQLEKYSAPVLVILAVLLLAWAYIRAGGFGNMLSQGPQLTWPQFWALFFPSLTANVGSWAAVALSISDFSRYARSQADQVLGQLGLPLFMGSFAFVGLAVTSATETIFGQLISDPIKLLSQIDGALAKIVAIPGITLAILTTNIPANIVAPANALVSVSPSTFGFKSGALLTALVSIAFQPWRIYSSPDSFVYTWLVGYSAVMGPLAGVLLTDYYVLRHAVLDVDELYSTSPDGAYYYCRGFNVAAMVAVVVSFVPIVPGFLHKLGMLESTPAPLIFIYNIGWFYGFFSSVLVYVVLSRWKWLKCDGDRSRTASSSPHRSLTDALLAG